ncbi:MAG: cytochrome c oxidase subunit 3 [Anaerolineaceae bacterium]|nr:cytochrome c oxidase subunit 3 [Anaerolineaceae bacterium]
MTKTLAPGKPYTEPASRQELLAAKNRRLGLLIFQVSWMMTFICLSVVNWQLRWQYADWPPSEITLNRIFPSIATLLLLASLLLFRSARGTLTAVDARFSFRRRWWLGIALGFLFVAIMAMEFFRAPMLVGTTYRDVFRVMTGFHLAHALVIGWLAIRVLRNPSPEDGWAIEAAIKLWDFVFIAWLIFYAVLYWI